MDQNKLVEVHYDIATGRLNVYGTYIVYYVKRSKYILWVILYFSEISKIFWYNKSLIF